jgi:hypothetical protein
LKRDLRCIRSVAVLSITSLKQIRRRIIEQTETLDVPARNGEHPGTGGLILRGKNWALIDGFT